MSLRPKNLENPYYHEDGSHLKSGDDKYCFDAYERGAGDMLKALKELGEYQNPCLILKYLGRKGWLVFIPDISQACNVKEDSK